MGVLEYLVIATIIITGVYVGMAAYEESKNEVGETHQIPINTIYDKPNAFQKNTGILNAFDY